MVTVNKVIMRKSESALYDFYGLSTDSKPNDWEGLKLENGSSFFEMDLGAIYMWDSEHKIWILIGSGGGGGDSAIFLGNIDETTTSFPTSRPGGEALKSGDYLRVSPDATLPFEIGELEFTAYRDLAVYLGGEWVKSTTPAQRTNETPVSDSTQESLSGSSDTQAKINVEVKEFLAGLDEIYSKLEVDELLERKQDTLVSGTNIKTINGASVLGEGDITVTGEPTEYLKTIAKDTENQTITITDKNDNEVSFGYGATTSGVTSVNGKTGDVTLVKADIGLENVDNTSDTQKRENFTGTLEPDNRNFPTAHDVYTALLDKQDKLTAGENITIDEDNVISALGGVESVNGHTGVVNLTKADLSLDNVDNTSDAQKKANFTGTIDPDNNNFPLASDVYNELLDKQDKLTAGTNITIEDNVISATGGGGGTSSDIEVDPSESISGNAETQAEINLEIRNAIGTLEGEMRLVHNGEIL